MPKKRSRKRKATPTALDAVSRFLRPTAAREAHNDFVSAGIAFRVVPMIETLRRTNRLTQAQFDNLAHYREQAHQAEDDMKQSTALDPDRAGGSSTGGAIPAILLGTAAILETARIERDLQSLRHIARAIAVDDKSITQWCIDQYGGRERYDGKGNFIAMVPVGECKRVATAIMELRMAARRIVR